MSLSDFAVEECAWLHELQRLADAIKEERGVWLKLRWSFGSLFAMSCSIQVGGRKIQIFLSQESRAGSLPIVINVALPEKGAGFYTRQVNETGHVLLGAIYMLDSPNNLRLPEEQFVERIPVLAISDSLEWLSATSSEFRIQ